MKKILSWFLAGLATLLPIVISIYLIYWLFTFIDGFLAPLLTIYLGQTIPGLGFLITIVLVIVVGIISTNIIGGKIFAWWESILVRIPLLGKIYRTVKRITGSFFNSGKKNAFRQVALVEFPRKGVYSIGFVTNDQFPYLDEDCLSLFVPTTPNPTSGFFIIVPKDSLKILDISVEAGIEMVISAGMIANNQEKELI